ncbi:DNA-binding protein Alba [Candidatus Bathyarchaeota archaeon]|nr:DNA-binding protein Alba [Candidatus Bathyarchaeota archaeon]
MIDDYSNTVIISSKPIMNYVVASITLFNQGVEKVIIRARGRHISKAIDVTELLKNTFFKGVIIEEILIGTDILHRDDGKKVNISSIQINLVTKI